MPFKVKTRKFFCDNAHCSRNIFAEKLEGLAGKYSRRTLRLDDYLIRLSML